MEDTDGITNAIVVSAGDGRPMDRKAEPLLPQEPQGLGIIGRVTKT